MLTPQKIQDLADPIESIYISMTNELMVNIGKHITSPNWTHTAAWEIQKLSELGQLTAENAAIINGWIAQIPDEIRDTMEETRRIALEGIEQDLAKAADKGYLTPPMRDSTYDVLNEYGQQAADKLNMVNTTMLESSVEMYKRGIAMVMSEEQAAAAQGILNEETGAVVSGTETRTQALQRAIGRMNDEGITGFYDRAGRSWSAEAYVNMDIRTTVHNTAIQSVKNRMNDYGAQVFQVSAHAGARPLCYPYQGKMFSWDNTAGEIEDGNGKTWKYAPLNSTSYGQAAGLFGVNCGHSPIPIIPGVSIPHAQDYVQPKSENDKAYAESQEQRALERKIRNAKRAIEMGDDSPEAKQRLKDAQKDMRQFINETGRTRRYDRESLYGGKKAPTPPADQRPTPASKRQESFAENLANSKVDDINFDFTFGEAGERYWRGYYEDGSKIATSIDNTIAELQKEYPMQQTGQRQYACTADKVIVCDYDSAYKYLPNGENDRRLDTSATAQVFENTITVDGKEVKQAVIAFNRAFLNADQTLSKAIEQRNESIQKGETVWAVGGFTCPETTAIHEWGHVFSNHMVSAMIYEDPDAKEYLEWYETLSNDEIRNGISDYAASNRAEFEAECFLEMQMPNPRPLAMKFWDYMVRVLEKGY